MSSPEIKEIIAHFAYVTRHGKLRPSAEQALELEASRLLLKYSPHEIKIRIDKTRGKKAMVINLMSLFPEMEEDNASAHIPAETNLIVDGEFYYHPELREIPSAPTATLNHDGSVTQEHTPFFLELKHRYTLGQLYEYFIAQCQLEDKHKQKTIRSLEELVHRYGLDLILFTIDEAIDRYEDSLARRIRSPWDLDRYLGDAEDQLDMVIGNAKANRINQPIPKWRVEESCDHTNNRCHKPIP